MNKENLHFLVKVAIALLLIGVVCDAFAWLLNFPIRGYIFRPLQQLGIYKPTASGTANAAPAAGGTSS